jgi:mannose-6-phosphate isomerase-like protein (cupin superfamily)
LLRCRCTNQIDLLIGWFHDFTGKKLGRLLRDTLLPGEVDARLAAPSAVMNPSPEDNEASFQTKRLPVQPDAVAPDGSDVRVLPGVVGGGLAHFELGPNQTSVAVVHRTVEEIWYFLQGRGEMWRRLGERAEIVEVGTGVCITIPLGTEFQFRSFGYESLAAIGATTPPWPGSGEATLVDGCWEPTVAPGPT